MKKIASVLVLSILFVLPLMVFAVVQPAPDEATAPDIAVVTALKNATDWLFGLLILIAAMFLVFAAFTYVTASGDAEKVKSAHNSVMYALVGVAVAVLAKGLVYFVGYMLKWK